MLGGVPAFTRFYDPRLNWHKPVNNFWDHIDRMNRKARRLSKLKDKKKYSKEKKKRKRAFIDQINAFDRNKDVKLIEIL